MTSISLRSAAIIGPAVAAVLVASTGPRPAFLLDAATFVVSFLTLARLHEPSFVPRARQSMFRDIHVGLVEVWRRAWVTAVLVMAALQLMLAVAPEMVLLPIIGRREFHTDAVYGTSLALLSAGGLLGALLALRWRPRRSGLVAMMGLLPFTLVPIALATPFSRWWIFAAYFIAGLGLEPFIIYWQVALQREFRADVLARVTALDWLCSFALMPLGFALTGPAVDAVGESTLLWIGAVVAFVPPLLVLVVPGLPEFRTPRAKDDVELPAPVAPGV
jgi:DHA3 family tetracycline resistance protein-like MFS transporter